MSDIVVEGLVDFEGGLMPFEIRKTDNGRHWAWVNGDLCDDFDYIEMFIDACGGVYYESTQDYKKDIYKDLYIAVFGEDDEEE